MKLLVKSKGLRKGVLNDEKCYANDCMMCSAAFIVGQCDGTDGLKDKDGQQARQRWSTGYPILTNQFGIDCLLQKHVLSVSLTLAETPALRLLAK